MEEKRRETAQSSSEVAGPDPVTVAADSAASHVEYNPKMPHNLMDADELERQYPSLEAVEDLDLQDLSRLEDDQLYSAGMNVVQKILHEMSQVGRTRRQGTDTPSGQAGVPEPEGVRKRTRSGGSDGDRSGFGPGGDKSGNLAVVDSRQVCAMYGCDANSDSDIAPYDAHPSCAQAHPPLRDRSDVVASGRIGSERFGAKIGRVLNSIQFPYDGGTAHSTDTEHPKGDRCKNSACLSAFPCLRRNDIFDADSASRDAKLCRPRLGPTSTTFSAEELCSKIASPSSPRRSVERCVFNFMSHCCSPAAFVPRPSTPAPVESA